MIDIEKGDSLAAFFYVLLEYVSVLRSANVKQDVSCALCKSEITNSRFQRLQSWQYAVNQYFTIRPFSKRKSGPSC